MDVREKLVELIFDSLCRHVDKSCKLAENIADDLISNGVTVHVQDGCEYCNGLPFSQMEDFTMPDAFKKDYDIVTIRYCPMCGRRLPQPPKGE